MNSHEKQLGVGVKEELKIGMALDDYKLPNIADWWARSMEKIPNVERLYDLVDEKVGPGVTEKTLSCVRTYKMKAKVV